MPLKRTLIFIDGQDRTDSVSQYSVEGEQCTVVFTNSPKSYTYNKDRIQIVETAVTHDSGFQVFNYLKEIASAVGLKTETGLNTLWEDYNNITHIPKSCILSNYLNAPLPYSNAGIEKTEFYPFGFNLSQQKAVNQALSYPLSQIEGPPGTGKTQTILNIIANILLKGKTVAVVSGNNSATQNVMDKLSKEGIDFIAAFLGNSENKNQFIDTQRSLPDLSNFKLENSKAKKLAERLKVLFQELTQNIQYQNELAQLQLEITNVQTEFQHFQTAFKNQTISKISLKRNLSAQKTLELWVILEELAKRNKKLGFFKRIFYRWKYGISSETLDNFSLEEMIFYCQFSFYQTKTREISKRIKFLKKNLENFSFDPKMKEYTEGAMLLFKAELYKKFRKKKRKLYSLPDLRNHSEEFIKDYPVILSTTYSLRRSLAPDFIYDFVIIDESSQVDLVTGALALSCAKRAVIVGDLKQLPNVVDQETEIKTNRIFNTYNLPSAYQYASQSLLSSISKLLPYTPKSFLREHYRCHPKIIEFCNQKFYGDQLIVQTAYSDHRPPLLVYKTVPGNHARDRTNQRQIDVIKHEIIPNEKLENVDLGIVTPYRNQTNALQEAFQGTSILADTVDKFQGRENEVIILSTVDNNISDFTDNPNRLNVAVSRAIDQLILVVNGNENQEDSNINDLIQYIEYNNFTIIQSELHSIFDYLYKGYEVERAKQIQKSGKVSEYDSENLMYGLIKKVLTDDRFTKYDVLLHFPFRHLFKDFSKLNPTELKYATHPWTHLDFLIYNKLGKKSVLAIEVDGYEFHKEGTAQAERDQLKNRILEKYDFPILRFKTNESGEREKLIAKLLEIQGGNGRRF